jgi:imidazolonepropionase-like amidohydrolase
MKDRFKFFILFIILFFFGMGLWVRSQTTHPINGIASKEKELIYYAFIHANIFIDYQTLLHDASLLIQNGKIIEVGRDVKFPASAIIYDMKGKFIYPSFIDLDSQYGMPAIQKAPPKYGPQYESAKEGAFNWNQAIKPETEAASLFKAEKKTAEEYRKNGFGAVLSFQHDGIARGTSSLVSLAEGRENELVLLDEAAAHYSLNKGSSTQAYPSSQMGAIALLRQTYYDAKYLSLSSKGTEVNLSLEAWSQSQALPQIFEVNSHLEALRADKIGDEFEVQYIIKGSGKEYQRIDDIKNIGADFIIPINFPKVYEVEDIYDAKNISLSEMKHWELAPTNCSYLEKNKIDFAITSNGTDNRDFLKNIRKAIDNGLSQTQALKSLTYTPARLIHAEEICGSLKKGMLANFIITSDSVFKEKSILYESWIQGKQHIINDYNIIDIRGTYQLIADNKEYKLEVKGEIQDLKANIILKDTLRVPASIDLKRNTISLTLIPHKDSVQQSIRLLGFIDLNNPSQWKGYGESTNGDTIKWIATKTDAYKEEIKKDSLKNKIERGEKGKIFYPFTAYGNEGLLQQQTVLIKNTMVWTNESDGILPNTDVLIQNGKIAAIGKNLAAPKNGIIIDGIEKHLTAGIIDEHSHIAISAGVNEGAQSISAEVRIGDVINSEDINIYRQLAGGVTTAQLLHGSANPIGGQSALIKLRWGQAPEKMKFAGADAFIKFALGENVKQSNWGDNFTIRYPQSRMGVEQIYYDAFIRAKEYERGYAQYKSKKSVTPRKDLEMEALVEILNKKRFITCHSYVQSEINMLMHIADSMKFKVNTFTHILEGYKVADKMKAHDVGASTFADWWAYKFEVNDAIPYNAAILNNMGITTAINSDDAEMGRRLNQEAAKAIKYGGVSQVDALKLVTLNPAKLLHIDNRVGSIKIGKDADLVLWSDNPLSVYAKAEKTFVDGICYYDIEKDAQIREAMQKERARLIQKMLLAKKNGEPTQKAEKKEEKIYHCEDGIEKLED